MDLSKITGEIWFDGEMIDWQDANTHLLTHTLHYGLGVFEGVRAYKTNKGPSIFRLHDHTDRLYKSASTVNMEIPYSKDIINEETLEYFPTGAIITNVARGDMIDDVAMVKALISRKIYAIGLDVYKGEPKIHHEYLKQPTAFILPHLGSATKKTRTAMANLAIDNIDEFFSLGKCKNKVN